MRTCQSCGLQNPPDRDFCECGEYLRWEPTAIVSAITPEMAAQAAAEAGRSRARAAAAARPPPSPPPRLRRPPPEPAAPPPPPPPQPAPEPTGYVEATPPPRVSAAPPQTPPEPGNGRGLTSGDPLGGSAAAPPPPPAAPTGPKGTEIMGAVPPPRCRCADASRRRRRSRPSRTWRRSRCGCRIADSDKEHTLVTAVEPGQRERVLCLVRNQSGIVDNYKLRDRRDAAGVVVDLPGHGVPGAVRDGRDV